MNNQYETIVFKPSLKPEYLKLCFSIILALFITILAKNGVFNPDIFKFNLSSINIEIFKNSEIIINILSIIYILTFFYICLKLLGMLYIK